jgi:7-cyano-7-deazaguanine synthase in queuosine biosynthesis
MKINIVCDFLRLGEYQDRFQIAEKAVYLSSQPQLGNIHFDLRAIERDLGRELDSLSLDLCEIAAFVYLADKSIARGEFDRWARTLSFLVPVRNPSKWNSVRELLTNTVVTLTGDNVQFRFVKRREEKGGDEPRRSADYEPTVAAADSDSVCLFSGGLDSFAGAVYLLGQGRRPLFVSHYVNATLKGVQSNLMAEIRSGVGRPVEHFQYRLTSRRPRDERYAFKARESSHRARSFLFMSFAAAAAAARDLRDIYICENGVLALNVPISEARKGSRSTRHAHPLYLRYFNELIGNLYEREFAVENPFLFWTKGEESEFLKDSGFGPAIKQTVSCWGYPNQTISFKDSNHCGYCIPCLVRRASLASSGLASYDDRYHRDAFGVHDQNKPSDRNTTDLIHFCRSIVSLSFNDLLYRYPEFITIEAHRSNAPEDKVTKIIKVYKKFANEVLALAKQ